MIRLQEQAPDMATSRVCTGAHEEELAEEAAGLEGGGLATGTCGCCPEAEEAAGLEGGGLTSGTCGCCPDDDAGEISGRSFFASGTVALVINPTGSGAGSFAIGCCAAATIFAITTFGSAAGGRAFGSAAGGRAFAATSVSRTTCQVLPLQ